MGLAPTKERGWQASTEPARYTEAIAAYREGRINSNRESRSTTRKTTDAASSNSTSMPTASSFLLRIVFTAVLAPAISPPSVSAQKALPPNQCTTKYAANGATTSNKYPRKTLLGFLAGETSLASF